jgi:hypothetical protein
MQCRDGGRSRRTVNGRHFTKEAASGYVIKDEFMAPWRAHRHAHSAGHHEEHVIRCVVDLN